jgi:polar amino acid transport system permease protein
VGDLVVYLPSLTRAAGAMAALAVITLIVSTLAGIVCGNAISSGPRIVRAVLRGYVDTIRGIPILVLLFTAYFVLPSVGFQFDAFTAAIVALSLFATAHITEIVRGGLGSLSRTALDAALSLGLTAPQRFRLVTVPLLLPRVIPPWTNTAVEIVKATSLASLIGVIELTYATQSAAAAPRDPWPFYLFAAGVYFAVDFGISRAGALVERRFRYLEY